MKKSLVITTIATVLVIVVALTTATFAWFSASSNNEVTSNFTAQTSNAVFTFYPWSSGNNQYDYANGSSSLDLTQFTTLDTEKGHGGFITIENMKPYVPFETINPSTPVVMTGNWAGLPGEAFYTAQENNGQLTDAYKTPTDSDTPTDGSDDVATQMGNSGFANIARFELVNGKNAAKNVDISITITGKGNSPDVAVAEEMRVILIGVPSADNAGAKPFIVGTEYVSGGDPTVWDDTFTEGIYVNNTTTSYTQEGSAYKEYTGYVNLITPASMNRNPGGTLTYSFPYKIAASTFSGISIAAGASYDIYLYIWLDGSEITDGGAGGAVDLKINFLDSTVQGGSENTGG